MAVVGSLQLARPLPLPVIHVDLVRTSAVRGSVAPIPWPSQGQAAIAVPALGVVLASGPERPVPIASLTKIMTAYVVLRDHPLAPRSQGPEVTIDASDQNEADAEADADDTTIPVQAGEVLSERQLLDGLLVHSANNLADVLARWDAGSIAGFVSKMNSAAAALGMRDTQYVDTNGLSQQSVSTAADQLRVGSAAMKIPTFAAVVAQTMINLPIAGTVANYVRQIGTDGIVGVKSGFTQAAMGCLVLAAQRQVDGHVVIVMAAVTGQPGFDPLDAAASATEPLLDATAASLREVRVVARGTSVARVVTPWSSTAISGVTARTQVALAWPGDVVRRSMKTFRVRNRAPAGTTLGRITITVGAQRLTELVRSTKSLSGPSLAWRLEHF
jgi:D-alanyl-D-alanine carboxypeptidase (penicillin-binding protein 5/6)